MASLRANLVFGLLSCFILSQIFLLTEAQFFTKSSSKSIPRMGRRSDDQTISNQYRHFIIDNLIDTYGPNLLEALIHQNQLALAAKNRAKSGGELFFNNEQPEDLVKYDFPESSANTVMLRNERSSGSNSKDASLAMRAFNINRYMQHLASGQPLVSYDKLFNGNEPATQSVD